MQQPIAGESDPSSDGPRVDVEMECEYRCSIAVEDVFVLRLCCCIGVKLVMDLEGCGN